MRKIYGRYVPSVKEITDAICKKLKEYEEQ